MVVGGKYELGAVAAECAGWRTFDGREIPSGRAVLVHQILEPPSGSPRPAPVGLAERYGHVIDTCSCDGVEYVVTETLSRGAGEERFTRVGAWRVPASFRSPPAPEPAEASVSGIFNRPRVEESPAPAAMAPSEFTQLFQAKDQPRRLLPRRPPNRRRPRSAASSAGGRWKHRPRPPAMAPSEFTQLFQAKVSAETPAPPPPPASSEPGDFTRMFRAPAPGSAPARPASPPMAPPPPAKSAPGEFTQFFQPSLGSTPFETPSSPVRQAEPPAPSAGEYTRLFRSPAPPSSQARSSGATGVFHTPSGHSPAPPLPADAGPSDFTRMIQSQPQPAAEARPPEAPKAASPEPAAKKPAVPAVLIAVLAALAVLAIGMVLFFALRR